VRAATFALAAVGLAAGAHVLANGTAPSWRVCAAAGAVIGLAARGAAERERGLAPIAAAMVGLQGALHCLFSLFPATPARSVPATGLPLSTVRTLWCHGAMPIVHATSLTHAMPGMTMPGMGGLAVPAGSVGTGQASTGAMSMGAGGCGVGMLVVHLVVAVLLAWWLRWGEGSVWALARSARRVVVLILWMRLPVTAPVFGLAGPLRRLAEARGRRLRSLLLRHSLVLRGPPAAPLVSS